MNLNQKMNQTAKRTLVVILFTVVSCCAYNLFLVPILESPIQKLTNHGSEISPSDQESPYTPFFEEGDWELTPDCHLFRSNNVVMFFKNISMDDTMKVKSEKCTILIAPGEVTFPMVKRLGKPFYPIKVSIHEGGEIQLSSEGDQFDARPLGGRLLGPVTITYKMQIQGHWVDCAVKTSDLFCDMQSLQTSRPVRFMLGPFSAEGSQFKLLFEKSSDDQLFSGIRYIQLGHLEHITLRINPILLQQMNFKMTPEVQERVRQMFGNQMEIPITLKCDGPLLYDVASGTLKFSQNVVLSCNYPNAPPDRMVCGELEIRLDSVFQKFLTKGDFKPAAESEQTASQNDIAAENAQTVSVNPVSSSASPETASVSVSPEMEGFPVESIHARQNVTLSVPTLQCTAEAENLSFFTRNLQLQLSGNEQSTIRMGQNEFHAFELSYTFPPGNMQAIGTIQSDQKGGWLKTSFEGRGTEPPLDLILRWSGRLLGRPREKGRYDVQVAGQVVAFSEGFGEIKADAFSARMRPRTPEDDQNDLNLASAMGVPLEEVGPGAADSAKKDSQPNFLPELLRAQGNVQLQVNQGGTSLDASLTNIEFEFQKPAALPPGLQQVKKAERQRISSGESPQTWGFAGGGNFRQNSSLEKDANLRQFSLKAGDLKGKILLLPGKEGFFVREVSLEGVEQNPILLYEETPMLTSEQAVTLQARRVFLHDLHPQTLQCEISGPDTYLAGLGVRLESSQMALNCAANRIDINGAGKMTVFSRKSAGASLNYSTMTETSVSWEKGLSFNGQKITAKDHVQIKMGATSLCADLVYADLMERIQLSSPPQISAASNGAALDLFQNISAEHNVLLTHKNFTTAGDLSDIFMLSTHFLNFFPETMTVDVTGTGFLRLSHHGSVGNVLAQEDPLMRETDANSVQEKEWFQILMEYNQGITGKLSEGEFSIKGRVSALAHPVPNPEYMISGTRIDPRKIPEKGFQFRCDEIFVNQIPMVQNSSFQMEDPNEKKVEIQARGNVHMENSTFSVEGSLLKYSQEKDTCSIEGEPNIPVYIVQQEFRGGRRNETKAGSVDINLKTMKFKAYNVTIDSTF
ncbi:MAG: hypothetical protein IJQ31_05775 [Thermoguttaceae bacterium]|nr:hypothetical protein [Thermoguttaceae bacterium]